MQTSCRTRLCLQNCNPQSTLCCRYQHCPRWHCSVACGHCRWDMTAASVWAKCDVWSLASHLANSEAYLSWLTNDGPVHARTILGSVTANDLSILDQAPGPSRSPRHETWLLTIVRTLDWNSLHSCDKMIETWHWAHRDRVLSVPLTSDNILKTAITNIVCPIKLCCARLPRPLRMTAENIFLSEKYFPFEIIAPWIFANVSSKRRSMNHIYFNLVTQRIFTACDEINCTAICVNNNWSPVGKLNGEWRPGQILNNISYSHWRKDDKGRTYLAGSTLIQNTSRYLEWSPDN